MDISALDKAEVLAALYNGSKQHGMGFMHGRGDTGMTVKEACDALKKRTYFNYLNGRVMKIDLSGDDLSTSAYNRDVGKGAAERIIEELLERTPTQAIDQSKG